jgi:hypothetical protein
MDCVQFTIEAMRQVQDLVHKLKAAILGSDLSRLWHLSGHCVYFWVYDVAEDEMTLPPSSRKGQDVASLCEALATYQVDKSPSVEAGKPIPATIHVEFGKSSRGCVFYATPFNAGVPDSEFFRRTSFELGYVFPIWHTRPDALGILIKLVADHDQPGIDQLLVTVGGADRTGTRYVSDEALFLFLLDQPDLITLLPRHIKRVTAHLWSTGAIYELYPKFLCTSKGIPPPSRL